MRRMRRIAGLVCALQVGALAPAPVWAQGGGRTDKERAAQARKAFEAGKKAYNLGDFDKAIELWKQAYEYRDDPIFLYNIAQAYRQKGDAQKAIFFYRAYIREQPRARNRAEVDAKIADLQKQLEAQPPPPPEPPPSPEPPPAPASAPSVPPRAPPPPERAPRDEAPVPSPGKPMRIAGLVTGGAGVLALGVGVVFALRARSIQSDLETAARSGQPWSAELVDKESSGQTASTLGVVGIGVGAAAVVTGATLFWLGTRKDAAAAREVAVTPLLGPAAGGLLVTVSY